MIPRKILTTNFYTTLKKVIYFSVSTTTTWAENSNRIVQRSQAQRGKAVQMRSDIENLINAVSSEIWDAWSNTNNALARRAAELLETKSKLQMHLHKVCSSINVFHYKSYCFFIILQIQQEVFDIEKNMELIRKAIQDKSNPMKVAHTRLEARTHRKEVELCRDMAQDR